MKIAFAAALPVTLLAAAAPAFAQMPPQGGQGQPRSVPGVSQQGNAILTQAMNAHDAQLEQVIRQQGQVRDQLNAAANAPTTDVDRVATLMRQREDLQTQFRQLADARMLNALRQLSPADRPAFMRALAATPGAGAGAGRQ